MNPLGHGMNDEPQYNIEFPYWVLDVYLRVFAMFHMCVCTLQLQLCRNLGTLVTVMAAGYELYQVNGHMLIAALDDVGSARNEVRTRNCYYGTLVRCPHFSINGEMTEKAQASTAGQQIK